MSVRVCRTIGLGLALLLQPGLSSAVEVAGIHIARVEGPGWLATGVALRVDLARGSGRVQIARLELPAPVGVVGGVVAECPDLRLTSGMVDCPAARFRLLAADTGTASAFTGAFRYEVAGASLRLRLDDLPLGADGGDGRAQVTVSLVDGVWDISLRASALTLANEAGTLASEQLALDLKARLSPAGPDWDFAADVALTGGQAYAEPVFLDLDEAPLRLAGVGRWRPGTGLEVQAFTLDNPGALRARGRFTADLGAEPALDELELRIEAGLLPGLYSRYLQPFLIGTPLDSLDTDGRVGGDIALAGGGFRRVRLDLAEVTVDDRAGRLALTGLGGELHWEAAPAAEAITRLEWQGGSVYRVPVGTAAVRLATSGSGVRLLEPLRLPVLDGALRVRRLEVTGAGTPDITARFDGTLEPLGLPDLSRALGWPEFGGRLGGELPALDYRGGTLRIDGLLAAEAFDGRVEVASLRVDRPFGPRLALTADLKLEGLDLEQLTRAFAFGRIEGRLSGAVTGLRLLDWRPVAFDGHLRTVPVRGTRQRISQRAIENIADLGGGGGAAVLSRGFLRFFDDFGYRGMALGCQLRDGVCRMSGRGPHPGGGFYIVQGRGLPRVDVIGFGSRVNFATLLAQLESATRSEGPVVR